MKAQLTVIACALALAVLPAPATATPATGGVGQFGGAIDWVVWGTNNTPLNLSGPITKDSVTTFAGHELKVSCTISNFARAGGGTPALRAYRSGNWSGDALDDLYNIGGTQANNTLVNGLAVSAMEVSFDFACSATLDGNPYTLEGLVFADAEQSGATEFVQGEIPTSATWRLIDRYRTAGCTNDSQVTRTVAGATQTLKLDNPPSALCSAGPAAVAFADGATSGRITVRGGGTSAVALGAVLTFDHGDAPASYGDALHAAPYAFSGGQPATGTTALFGGNTLATTAQPALRLGPSVDPEGQVFSATANADDSSASGAFGPGDDETEAPPATIDVDRGGQFTHTVSCSGAGVLAGWVDWNANGTFEAGERAGNATCTLGTASLTWTVPANAVSQTRSFMRLRYAATPAEIADPSGLALSGEVEDHALAIVLPPDLTVAKSAAPTTVEPGGQVTWTITVRNLGPGASAASTLTDTIPAGITNVTAPGCTVAAGTATCSVGALAVNGSRTFTITGTAPSTTSTCFSNTATVTAADDRDTTNNSAQASACTRPPRADVRLTKSASAATVVQGGQVTYTLTVSNAGPDPAQAVQVTDAPAAGITPLSATPSQGTCPTPSSCNLGTLAASGIATIQVVARAADLGVHGNTATASTSTTDTDLSNNTDSATVTVEPEADLSITKTASQTALTEGDDFTYTLTIHNAGPSTAVDAVVTDSIPAGVRVRSVSDGCIEADPVVCRLGDIASGGTVTVTIAATATDAGSPVNSAIVASPTPDPDTGNNLDETRLTTSKRADLAITKTASASSVLVGESLTYTLVVGNAGPSTATGTVVTDRIPDGMRLDAATSSQGTCAGAPTVVCDLGSLAKGDQVTIRLTVTPLRSGPFTNTASVTSEVPDANPDNNLDDALVEAGTEADLAIEKSASAKTVVAGGAVVYSLIVRNTGPNAAANVTVTDPIPAGLRIVSAAPSAGTCATTGNVILACDLGDVADGAAVTIRIQAVATQPGSTRDVASVTSTTPDPDPKDNQDETQVTSEKADLALTKTAKPKKVKLGGSVGYVLQVANRGPSRARGVVVVDPVPEALRIAQASPTIGSCAVSQGAIVCELGDLAPGAVVSVSVRAKAVRQGAVNNAASATLRFPSDPDLSNNSASAKVTVKPGTAKIGVRKRASRRAVAAGDRVRYRIAVRNRGARTARSVTVCDRLPAGLSYLAHPGARMRHGQACWTVATLAPHTSRTFRVSARVLDGGDGRLVNLARVKGANTARVRDEAAVRRTGGGGDPGGLTG